MVNGKDILIINNNREPLWGSHEVRGTAWNIWPQYPNTIHAWKVFSMHNKFIQDVPDTGAHIKVFLPENSSTWILLRFVVASKDKATLKHLFTKRPKTNHASGTMKSPHATHNGTTATVPVVAIHCSVGSLF